MSLAQESAPPAVRGSRWGAFVVGLVAQIVFSATFLGLPTASALIRSELHLGTTELALFLGAASLAVVLSEAPWGLAADRFGERRVLVLGIATCALLMLALAAAFALMQTPPLVFIVIVLFLAAAAGGAVTGPSGSAILGWFDARRHGLLVSLRVAAVPLGGAMRTVAYGALLTSVGGALTFAAVGLGCAATGILVLLFAHDPPHDRAAKSETIAHVWRRAVVWRVAGSGFLLDVAQFTVLTFAATALSQLFDFPLPLGLAAVALMQVAGGLTRVASGFASDSSRWFDQPAIVRTFCIVQVVCLVPFLWAGSLAPGVAVAMMVLAGTAGCAWQGAHFSYMARLGGVGNAGSALGLNNAATSFGAFFAQVVAGGFALQHGWQATIVVLGAVPALLAVVVFPGTRRIPV